MLLLLAFVAAIAFYSLWQKEKQANDERYRTGLKDGRQHLSDKLRPLLDDQTINRQMLIDELEPVAPSQPTQTSANVLVGSHPATPGNQPVSATTTVVADNSQANQLSRQDQETRNQNTLLFVASLLFVAAAAAFVSATMSDLTKLVGIWVAVAVFYVVGMKLHTNDKLRPAAVAFIGTSLGALPFAGIALYQLTDLSATHSWLITSLIGVVAYFYAALRLQSQVVSYLTLAFVVSLAAAFGDSLSVSVIWSFVFVIVLSLGLNLVALAKPQWLPTVFAKPIEDTANYLTPITLGASLLMIDRLELLHYEAILAVSTLQYLTLWLQANRYEYEFLVRLLAQGFLMVLAWDITSGGVYFGWILLVSALIQQIYSLAFYKSRQAKQLSTELSWFHVLQFVQLWSIAAWSNHNLAIEFTSLALLVIGLSSLALSLRSRQVMAGISGLIVSLILPIYIGRSLMTPSLDWILIAVFFLLLVVLIVTAWRRYVQVRSSQFHDFMVAALGAYSSLATILCLMANNSWASLVLAALGLTLWWESYVSRRPLASMLGSLIIGSAFTYLWVKQSFDLDWLSLALGGFMTAWLYPLHLWLAVKKDEKRADYALYVVWAAIAMAIAGSFFGADTKLVSAIAIILLAGTIIYEGMRRRNADLQELAFYIGNLGLMRAFGIVSPELNAVFYAHWAALAVAAMAWWRPEKGRDRLYIAVGLITAFTGFYALTKGGGYQLLFLVEHLALLIAGALLKKNWATMWGLIATCAAVLYFLRDVAFLSFAFLGLVVIGIVIWQLSKKQSQ